MDSLFDSGHIRHSTVRASSQAPAAIQRSGARSQTDPRHSLAPGRAGSARFETQGLPPSMQAPALYPRLEVSREERMRQRRAVRSAR